MGFYGILPKLSISVRDFNQPVGKFTFLLFGGEAQGRYKVAPQFLDEKGGITLNFPEREVAIEGATSQYNVVLELGSLKFPGPGEYTFQLLVDGKIHYQNTIDLQQAKQEDSK